MGLHAVASLNVMVLPDIRAATGQTLVSVTGRRDGDLSRFPAAPSGRCGWTRDGIGWKFSSWFSKRHFSLVAA
jgi:hypothetical protein